MNVDETLALHLAVVLIYDCMLRLRFLQPFKDAVIMDEYKNI